MSMVCYKVTMYDVGGTVYVRCQVATVRMYIDLDYRVFISAYYVVSAISA